MKTKMLVLFILMISVTGCGNNGAQDLSGVSSCARAPSIPVPAAHYASRKLFAKTVMEETARAMLDGQCKNAVGLTRTADNFYSVQCSDSGCDLESRTQP